MQIFSKTYNNNTLAVLRNTKIFSVHQFIKNIVTTFSKVCYNSINNLAITHCQKTFDIFAYKSLGLILSNQFYIVLI